VEHGVLGLFVDSGVDVILDSLFEATLIREVVDSGQGTSDHRIQILLESNHDLKQIVLGTKQVSIPELGKRLTESLEGHSQFSNLSIGIGIELHTSLVLLVNEVTMIFQKLSKAGCLIVSAITSCMEGGLVAARTSTSFLEAKFLVFSSSISFSHVSFSFSCHRSLLVQVCLSEVGLRLP
jgi:hypothetical protein